MKPITAQIMTYIDGEGFVDFYPPQYLALVEWKRDSNDGERPGLIVRHNGDNIVINILANTIGECGVCGTQDRTALSPAKLKRLSGSDNKD